MGDTKYIPQIFGEKNFDRWPVSKSMMEKLDGSCKSFRMDSVGKWLPCLHTYACIAYV